MRLTSMKMTRKIWRRNRRNARKLMKNYQSIVSISVEEALIKMVIIEKIIIGIWKRVLIVLRLCKSKKRFLIFSELLSQPHSSDKHGGSGFIGDVTDSVAGENECDSSVLCMIKRKAIFNCKRGEINIM